MHNFSNNNTQDFYVELLRLRGNKPSLTLEELLVLIKSEQIEYKAFGLSKQVALITAERAFKIHSLSPLPGETGSSGNGFIDYNDTSTTASPLALLADTWTTIPNDGQGAFTNKNFAPEGVTELMDSQGRIDPTQLSLGDDFITRNDFRVSPNVNNALLEFRYELGSGAGLYQLETNIGRLDDGSGKYYRFSLTTDYIYMGDENTLNNPILLQVRLSTDGTLINAGSVIKVFKGGF